VPPRDPLRHPAEVPQQVEAVGHLHRGRGGPARRLRERAAAVTAEHPDVRVVAQPCGQGGAGGVGEQVHGPVAFEVHQDQAAGAPATMRPLVHAEESGRPARRRLRRPAHQAQQRGAAGAEVQPTQQAPAGSAA
jgi:hypothetical protein